MKGSFEAAVGGKVDFAALDALDLHGKVGIDGCKVVKAPDEVLALKGGQSIVVNVEVPMPPGGASGEKETMAVVVGPDNPDFTPYDQISPFLINSIICGLTRGWPHSFATWPLLAPGTRVLIVEDVVTTGGSTVQAIERCREEGLEIAGTVAVLDRLAGGGENIVAASGGAPYTPLATIDEVHPERDDR